MSFLEFLLWAIGIVAVGVPAVFGLIVIVVSWIDSRVQS